MEGAFAVIERTLNFEDNRIQVVLGAPEADPEDVIKAYLSGMLGVGENVCDH